MSHSQFFYGTLRHLPLLEAVLGAPADALKLRPAALAGHRVHWVQDAPFPMICEGSPEDRATGLLAEDLTEEQSARLQYYEGGFGYELRAVTVETPEGARPSTVYFPQPGLWTPGAAFDLGDWARRWGALSCAAAQEVMGYFGARPAAQVAHMFPMIRARAAQKVIAGQMPSAGQGRRDEVQLSALRRPYANFFAIEEYDLSFRRHSGGQSPVVERAVLAATDAAIVLPYDPVRDRVLLVSQFRPGPYGRGDPAPWCLEPIAGRVDPGETPEEAARREAREEAGLTLQGLEVIGRAYPSPGTSTEFYHLFLGLAELPDDASGLGGLASEEEDIRSHILPAEDFIAMGDGAALNIVPAQLCALWLARHRSRLRAEAG